MAGQGDNYYGGLVDRAKLRSFVDRESALYDEEAVIKEDRRELYRELKVAGFDLASFRALVKESRMTDDERANRYVFLDAYRNAMGFANTQLGSEALERALQAKAEKRERDQRRKVTMADLEEDAFADVEPAGAA